MKNEELIIKFTRNANAAQRWANALVSCFFKVILLTE